MTEGPPTDSSPSQPTDAPGASGPGGPPGAGIFSLEQRPAAGLYLVAWLLIAIGVGLAFIGAQAAPGLPRLLIVAGLIVVAVGLAAAAGYQIVARSSRPGSAYRGPSPLILFLLVIVVVNVFGIVVSAVTGINGLDIDRPDVFLIGLLIQVACYFAVVWLFVLAPRALSWPDIVRRTGPAIEAIGTAIMVMLPVTVVALILGDVVSLLVGETPPQVVPIPQTFLDVGVDALAAIVLAPIGEELFFRGFATLAWLRDLGPRSALIRSAVFFALIHILNVRVDTGGFDAGLRQAVVLLSVLLPIGFVLAALYVRRGLVASVTAHMTYNGIIFALLLVATYIPPPVG